MSLSFARLAAPAAIALALPQLAAAQSEQSVAARRDRRHGRFSRSAHRRPADQRQRARSCRASCHDAAALRRSDPPHSQPEPFGRGLARALLSAARRRRARAVRWRAESIDRLHRRRHRLLGSRQHRDLVRHRSCRGAARPARHSLRRQCARRARLYALASAAGRPRGRLRSDDWQRRDAGARRRRRRAAQRRARLPCVDPQLREQRLSRQRLSWDATTRTAATS